MSSKRRRKPSGGRGASTTTVQKPAEKPRSQAVLPPSPFPSLGESIARGARAAGASPLVLAVAFLSLLATWAVFAALGGDPSARALAVVTSLPPLHVLFADVSVAMPPGASPAFSIGAVATLAALRAVTFGLLTVLILQALREGRTSMRAALGSLPRVVLVFAGLYVLHFALVVAGFALVRALLGQLAFLAAAAGLYFLAFSPVIAAAEGEAPAQALRRGVRAARLPGTRHLALVMGYFLVALYSGLSAPFPVVAPATPSLAAWGYGLVITFVHVAVLGALAYRWLAVREEVPPGRAPARTRPA